MDSKRSVRIPIDGLDCPGSGATAVERALASREGVLRAWVNPATEVAYVDYDPAVIDVASIANVIKAHGYTPGAPIEP